MDTVGTLLKDKGTQIFTSPPHTTVRAAVKLMTDRHVGALMVMQEDRPLGIFTERDALFRVLANRRVSRFIHLKM